MILLKYKDLWKAFVISGLFYIISIEVTTAQTEATCNQSYNDLKRETNASLNFAVVCPAGCTAESGEVWGTTTYSGNSSLCRAAIHDGTYLNDTGGIVTVEAQAVPASFTGSIANGITTTALPRELSLRAFRIVPDINECSEGLDINCHSNSTCMNTKGSYECVCKPGFSGSGMTCDDVDECGTDMHNCAETNSTCSNSLGGFTCDCKTGFSLSNDQCIDVDECLDEKTCSSLATCANSQGSFKCTCKLGYTGNGLTCKLSAASSLKPTISILFLMMMLAKIFTVSS